MEDIIFEYVVRFFKRFSSEYECVKNFKFEWEFVFVFCSIDMVFRVLCFILCFGVGLIFKVLGIVIFLE